MTLITSLKRACRDSYERCGDRSSVSHHFTTAALISLPTVAVLRDLLSHAAQMQSFQKSAAHLS